MVVNLSLSENVRHQEILKYNHSYSWLISIYELFTLNSPMDTILKIHRSSFIKWQPKDGTVANPKWCSSLEYLPTDCDEWHMWGEGRNRWYIFISWLFPHWISCWAVYFIIEAVNLYAASGRVYIEGEMLSGNMFAIKGHSPTSEYTLGRCWVIFLFLCIKYIYSWRN